mgnify:CR=1 FL=1
MNKKKYFSFILIVAMILGLALPGCQKTSEPSELPYEALHLGNFLFVITKTTEDTKTNLHLPVVAHFDEPQDLQVGDVMALAFDQLMESFPPQAVITSSKKLLEEHKAYLANFDLAQQLLEIRPEQTYLIDVRTKEEFEELLAFVAEQKFERLGVFPYSREEGTPAFRLPDTKIG